MSLGFDALAEDACPICAFAPLDKSKCTVPNSLRTTIAVFLRHAEKRHKDALAKQEKLRQESMPVPAPGESVLDDGSGMTLTVR